MNLVMNNPENVEGVISLFDAIKFVDWVSDKSYKRCANGEWIQTGTGIYNTVAKNTDDLYELFKLEKND